MIYIARWKIVLILTICVLAFAYSAPNVMGMKARGWLETLPGWMPTQTVNLGLDLRGGSHLLLEVDVDTVIRERSEDLVQTARPELRSEKVSYTRISALPGGMRLQLRGEEDAEKARRILRNMDGQLEIVISEDGQTVEARYNDDALKEIKDQTINQSIEIVRRRIDETGTREPAIQRQGDSRIIVQLPAVDNP